MLRIGLRSLYLTISCFVSICVYSQDWTISGQATDQSGGYLELAIVSVRDSLSNKLCDYYVCDKDGYFTLELHDSIEIVLLECRFIGYEPFKIFLQKKFKVDLDIVLSPTQKLIDDIVISESKLPVTTKGDTTIYNLNEFRDSTENVVEDILKKIPGFSISEDGEIKINNQSIEKLLIEGSDILGRNYTLGTKSIKSEFISEVEVLHNYTHNPLFKGMKNSRDIALNLILSDKAKKIINGNVLAGTGYGDELKYFCHFNLFSISKNKKYFLFSDNGNTGNQYDLESLQYNFGSINDDKFVRIENDYGFINKRRILNGNVPSVLVDNSKNLLTSFRFDFQLNQNLKALGSISFAKKSDEQNSGTTTQNISGIGDLFLSTQNIFNNNEKYLTSNLNLNYFNNRTNTHFDATINLDISKQTSSSNTIQSFFDQSNNLSFYDVDIFDPKGFSSLVLTKKNKQ